MKTSKESVVHDILVAVLFVASTVIFGTVFGALFQPWFAIRVCMILMASTYILTLSGPRFSKSFAALLALSCALTLITASAFLSLFGVAVFAAFAISCSRALVRYSRFWPFLIDVFLNQFVMALSYSFAMHSPILSLWTFFLLQGCFRILPHGVCKDESEKRKRVEEGDRFGRAYASAETALRRLIATT